MKIPKPAFVNDRGEPIPYGTIVKMGKEIVQVTTFKDGSLAFLNILQAFESHNLRCLSEEMIDMGKARQIKSVKTGLLLPVIDWIKVLNGMMTREVYLKKYP